MASVDFKKLKGPQEVKAMLRHCDKHERQQTTHSNKDIDLALTAGNAQWLGTYQDTCDTYDARIAALDAAPGANLRKDRVTCFGLSIPVPDGLTDDALQVDWMDRVMQCIGEQYGYDNILQGYGHWDEVHEYRDAETGDVRMSRPHLHAYVIPEHDGRLNGKWFSSRENMVRLNQAIQDMTQKDFGLDFMSGRKKKSRKEVETLKNESLSREIESKQSQLATLAATVAATQAECDRLQMARDGLQMALQGDLRTYQAREARQGATALLAALGASVEAARPKEAYVMRPDGRMPVRAELAASIDQPGRRSDLMQQMMAQLARDNARWAQSGPPTVGGPTR